MERADTQLWQGWRTRGDHDAFETLVRPHLAFAFDFARRLGLGPDQADDVVQEALVRLAAEDSERPVEVGLRAWLGRSVSLQTRMLKRSEGRRAKREQAYERPRSRHRHVDGDRYAALEAAITDLPPGQRQAVILRYRHDLEYREIAKVLGISENAARIRVHKAMSGLRDRFGKNTGPMVAALPLLAGGGTRNVVDQALAQSTATVTAGSTSAGLLLGALAVKNLLIAGAIVAVGALTVVIVSNLGSDTSDDPAPPVFDADVRPETPGESVSPRLAAKRHDPIRVASPNAEALPPAAPDAASIETLLETLLAKGVKLAYADPQAFEGTRHRLQWRGRGDPLPPGLPAAVDLDDDGLAELLNSTELLGALQYLSVSSKAFDDEALRRLAERADLQVLRLDRTTVTDEGMRHLVRMPSLKTLTLKHGNVSNDGAKHIGVLTNLKWLDVRDTHLSDAGMAHLSGLASLEKFEFGGTRVTDAGLEHLARVRLTTLNLEDTRIRGTGVKHLDHSRLKEVEADEAGAIGDDLLESLRGAAALEVLVLKETSITDAGLVHLATMPSLKELDLNDTVVTDEGLQVLARLPKLEELSLRQTSVTDAVIDTLLRIESLERVNLGRTRVTEAGVRRLKEAKPDLDVRGP